MLDPAFFLFAQALCKNARKRYCYHAYKHPYKGICRADLPLDIKGHTAIIPDILFKHDIKYYSENKFDGGNKTASDYSLCDKTKGAHTVLYAGAALGMALSPKKESPPAPSIDQCVYPLQSISSRP